ncbi:TonB-dependent receptor [Reichenbachiella carrageenanivorans]|uniref:TonB-dependent receptor n=1 Tax=Reichenbachiella carrageenanivorans TaxID=2979869 RepID=A0ABY6CWY6_9BACT|nr:TonB-dependent receptor [Reichenbachiella carrageenanivorans]UXX78407.1 TonB-dependent receptor [Reichenbachiella carrageenanivorans]
MKYYLVAIAMLCSTVASAQIAPDLDSISLSYELEELIIQSVRGDEYVGITETTVNKKEIEEEYNGEHPIFMINKLTPSVYSYSESGANMTGTGQMRLRGMAQERINFTLNGVPINDMLDQGVFFNNFTDITNSISSIQVQRGTGLSTNGTASYAGSVNFESVSLDVDQPKGQVQIGAGSFGTYRLNGNMYTGLLNNKFALYGSFSRLYSDGYRDHTSTNAYSFFFSAGYYGKKDFVKLTAFDANAKNGIGYAFESKTSLDQHFTTNSLDENTKDDFGQQMLSLQHTHKFSDEFKSVGTLYYNYSGGDYFDWVDPAGTFAYDQWGNYPLQNRHYGAMLNLLYSPNETWFVNTGAHYYIFNRGNQEAVSTNLANPYHNETSQKKEFSWFAKADLSLSKFTFTADLQIRKILMTLRPDLATADPGETADIDKDWFFVNPKASISYAASKQLALYASVGWVSREPTRIDILGGAFKLDRNNYDYAAGDNFKEEKVHDIEFGAKYRQEKFVINGNLFYMKFNDEIAPVGEVGEFGVMIRQNIDESIRYGVETDFKYQPIKKLSVLGSFTYMKSEIKAISSNGVSSDRLTGNEAVLTPNVIYNLGIEATPTQAMQLGLSANGISKSYLGIDNSEDYLLPDFALLNARIGYTWKNLNLNIEINNLLDEEYYTNGAPVDTDYDGTADGPGYYIGAKRNFMATLTIHF